MAVKAREKLYIYLKTPSNPLAFKVMRSSRLSKKQKTRLKMILVKFQKMQSNNSFLAL